MVEFGDHHCPWHSDLAALLPQRLGRFVDVFVRRDHEKRAVRGAQPGPQFADEIGVTGSVDEVDLDAVVQQRREGKTDRPLLTDLGLVVVADRGAVGDAAGSGQHAGGDQKGFDQCGLPAAGRAYQHHVPYGGRIIYGRGGSCALGTVGLVCHDVSLLVPARIVMYVTFPLAPAQHKSERAVNPSLRSGIAQACQLLQCRTAIAITGLFNGTDWYWAYFARRRSCPACRALPS